MGGRPEWKRDRTTHLPRALQDRFSAEKDAEEDSLPDDPRYKVKRLGKSRKERRKQMREKQKKQRVRAREQFIARKRKEKGLPSKKEKKEAEKKKLAAEKRKKKEAAQAAAKKKKVTAAKKAAQAAAAAAAASTPAASGGVHDAMPWLQSEMEAEAARIAKLEKRLGLNKKKKKKGKGKGGGVAASLGLGDDLDSLFGELEAFDNVEEEGTDSEVEEMEREYGLGMDDSDDDESDGDNESDGDDAESDDDAMGGGDEGVRDEAGGDDEEMEDPDAHYGDDDGVRGDLYGRVSDEDADEVAARRAKAGGGGGGYVPPHLRKRAGSGGGGDSAVERRIKGLINRLQRTNVEPLAKEVDSLFEAHSMRMVNNLLVDNLLVNLGGAGTIGELPIACAMLVGCLYGMRGIDVGAVFIERLVLHLDAKISEEADKEVEGVEEEEAGEEAEEEGDGEMVVVDESQPTAAPEYVHVLKLLVYLFRFNIVNAGVIVSLLGRLADVFTEPTIECLLVALRMCGRRLRSEEPAALRELILRVQERARAHEGHGKRVQFMIERLQDLKNNRVRGFYDEQDFASERAVIRHVKTTSDPFPMRMSWDDFVHAERKGRWWLVGTAWTGHDAGEVAKLVAERTQVDVDSKILRLAKKRKMNTEVKMAVFSIIMSSEDYLDAFEKLLKLGLRDKQDREIPRVLVQCCMDEKTYNPYYYHLAAKLCTFDRKHVYTFQYALWDCLKALGAQKVSALSNLAHLFANLIGVAVVPLGVLKVLDFAALDAHAVLFARILFTALLTTFDDEADLERIFKCLTVRPDLEPLREGLALFYRRHVEQKIARDMYKKSKSGKKKKKGKAAMDPKLARLTSLWKKAIAYFSQRKPTSM